MIEKLVTVFLIMKGMFFLFIKWNVKNKLKLKIIKSGKKRRIGFFKKLLDCEFCIEHHLAIIPTILVSVISGLNELTILFPFMAASLSLTLKEMRYGNR